MHYAIYDQRSGRICRIIEFPAENRAEASLNCAPGEAFVEVDPNASDDTHYIRGGEAREKEQLDTRYSVDGLTVNFSHLPSGTVLSTEGVEGEASSVEFDVPGTYSIHLIPPAQYLEETVEVEIHG